MATVRSCVACSSCRHREHIADSWSRCRHPAAQVAFRQVAPELRSWIELYGAALPLQLHSIDVVGEPDAVESGLFAWPFHFRPGQVRSCSGFCQGAANDKC